MTKIYVCDTEAERIDDLCGRFGKCRANIIEALFMLLDDEASLARKRPYEILELY